MIARTLREMVEEAFRAAVTAGELTGQELPDFALERPRNKEHGHWAANLALLLAADQRKKPRDIAGILISHLPDSRGRLDAVEVAGPGFINFTLSRAWMREELVRLAEAGDAYGRWQLVPGTRLQVEFISANPVGPMHVGHGRWAALGDALASLLCAVGYQVEREFYVNDYGNQMDIFAISVEARYLELLGVEVEFPEDGYRGGYIRTIAQEILDTEGEGWKDQPSQRRREVFKELAYAQVLDHLKLTLHRFGGGLRRLVQRADPARKRRTRGHASAPEGGGPGLRKGRGPVDGDLPLRRRQGPGAGALQRHSHLLCLRYRLSPR